VTRACQGVVFQTVQLVKALIEKTTTRTGLSVTVDIIDKGMTSAASVPRDSRRT
jgi:hypothetical protein